MSKLLVENKTKEPVLILPEHTVDNALKLPPNFTKVPLTFRKGKHWKPCTSEFYKLKKKLDKLSADYEQVTQLGMKVKAKRMFKKAVQLSKRISFLTGGGKRYASY